MAAASASRRWATGSLDVGSTTSDSDSESSDSEDVAAAPMAVRLLSMPTAGGLRARRDSGPVQLPAAGGDSDSEGDDFGESVVPLVMPTRCPSRRDSRRCGFGHEISTATAHKEEDMAAMRNEAETERLQRRQAEQMAQEEAERKAKVQEEGICVSEIVSLFSTTRPVAENAVNPTLSPAAAPVASDDHVRTEQEPSPPWSDGDVADRAGDEEEEDSSGTEDSAFRPHGGGCRRKSVVQFPGWSSKTAGVSSTSEPPDTHLKVCTAAPDDTGTPAADFGEVVVAAASLAVADAQHQETNDARTRTDAPGGADTPVVAGTRSVQNVDKEVETAAAEAQDAQQQRLAKLAEEQPPTAVESSSRSLAEAARAYDRVEATTARQAFASGADWAENACDEEMEMEFVDEIRALQIEQLVRSGRMPPPLPPHSGFQSARAKSRERDSRRGGRPTSRGFHSTVAVTAAAEGTPTPSAAAMDGSMVPQPPPKRAGSPAHKGRRPVPPAKAAAAPPSARVMAGRAVRGRTVAATATAPAAPVCV